MLHARYLLLICSLLSFTHCGKHETSSGVVGAASGAVVGTAVAGKRDKGTGPCWVHLLGVTLAVVLVKLLIGMSRRKKSVRLTVCEKCVMNVKNCVKSVED